MDVLNRMECLIKKIKWDRDYCSYSPIAEQWFLHFNMCLVYTLPYYYFFVMNTYHLTRYFPINDHILWPLCNTWNRLIVEILASMGVDGKYCSRLRPCLFYRLHHLLFIAYLLYCRCKVVSLVPTIYTPLDKMRGKKQQEQDYDLKIVHFEVECITRVALKYPHLYILLPQVRNL